MNKVNETRQLIERLIYLNEWRHGVHDDRPSPKQISEDIALAIKLLKERENL